MSSSRTTCEPFRHSTGPLFVEKVQDIVGLYLNPPDHAIVLCVDEKFPSLPRPASLVGPERDELQGLDRSQAVLPLERGKNRPQPRNYFQYNANNLFATFDVLEGTLRGCRIRCHRRQEFLCFLNAIDRTVAADTSIYVILDNYGNHKHSEVLHWLVSHPRFTFHFMPNSDSWLNAVKTFISARIQHRLKRGNLQSMVDLRAAINCYVDEHNGSPRQFIWTKTERRIPVKLNLLDGSLPPNIGEIETTIEDSELRRVWMTWSAGLMSIIVALAALIGSMSQERVPVNPALFTQAEIGFAPVPREASVGARDPLDEAAAEVRAPVVRSLIKELIAQRLANVSLSADWEMGGSHDELAHREAQSADTTASQAEIKSCAVRQAQVMANADAPACKQEAATKGQRREHHRQFPDARSKADDLRRGMDATDAVLGLKRAENIGQVPEAAVLETNSVGDTSLDSPEPPSALPSSTSVDAPAVMPIPKPRLRGSNSTIASNTINDGASTHPRQNEAVKDDGSIQASPPEVAVSHSEPMTVHGPPATPDTIDSQDTSSLAAPTAMPLMSTDVASDERGATTTSATLLKSGYRGGLNAAVARLADGLRVTREEAISQRQERVFTVDVENRAFISASAAEPVALDRALNMHLLTAKSELAGKSRGGIRFFADGSSTGGRIELELLGERATINVRWATGAVTVKR